MRIHFYENIIIKESNCISMVIQESEKEFIKGYANALQDILYVITGDNGNSKSYDPCDFYDNETLHSYAFDLKDGGRHHSLSDYIDIDEIKKLMLYETVKWIKDYESK